MVLYIYQNLPWSCYSHLYLSSSGCYCLELSLTSELSDWRLVVKIEDFDFISKRTWVYLRCNLIGAYVPYFGNVHHRYKGSHPNIAIPISSRPTTSSQECVHHTRSWTCWLCWPPWSPPSPVGIPYCPALQLLKAIPINVCPGIPTRLSILKVGPDIHTVEMNEGPLLPVGHCPR